MKKLTIGQFILEKMKYFQLPIRTIAGCCKNY